MASPEHAALIGDSVGVALLVVLETLAPAERLAFVLHDVFGLPFEEIAPMVDRSPAAARSGDLDRLVSVLHPDATLRADLHDDQHGAEAIARQAIMFSGGGRRLHPATVNGTAGVVVTIAGEPSAVMAFVVRDGRVAAIDAVTDPERLAALDLSAVLAAGH